jgi:hypothetical protein
MEDAQAFVRDRQTNKRCSKAYYKKHRDELLIKSRARYRKRRDAYLASLITPEKEMLPDAKFEQGFN